MHGIMISLGKGVVRWVCNRLFFLIVKTPFTFLHEGMFSTFLFYGRNDLWLVSYQGL